jgi:hypothetical protein
MSVTRTEAAPTGVLDRRERESSPPREPAKWAAWKTLLAVVGVAALTWGGIGYAAVRLL